MYTKPEVMEIGAVQEVILGQKAEPFIDDVLQDVDPYGELDD